MLLIWLGGMFVGIGGLFVLLGWVVSDLWCIIVCDKIVYCCER